MLRLLAAAVCALALVLAGCGGDDDDGGAAPRRTPSPRSRAACRRRSAPPQDPKESDFPATEGRTLQEVADAIGGGPEMGMAGSVFRAGEDNRIAFGVIDDKAGFVYGKTALYYAKSPTSPAKGPFPAPADVLVTDPPLPLRAGRDGGRPVRRRLRRGRQAARQAGRRTRSWPSPLVDGKPVAAPGQIQTIAPGDDKVPAVGDPAPQVQTDTVASAGGDVESIDTRRPTSDLHEVNFADVVGKKPVALLFATPQLCQSRVCGPVVDEALQLKSQLRRQDRLHPSGGLHGQRSEQGPARAAPAVRAPLRAVAVRRATRTARSPRGSKAPSGSTRSSRRSRPRCEHPRIGWRSPSAGAALLGAPARRTGARSRPADEPADPGVAVRLGGGDRARRLLRRARRAVADAAARGARLAPAAAASAACSAAPRCEWVCRAIGVGAARRRRDRRLRRASDARSTTSRRRSS